MYYMFLFFGGHVCSLNCSCKGNSGNLYIYMFKVYYTFLNQFTDFLNFELNLARLTQP